MIEEGTGGGRIPGGRTPFRPDTPTVVHKPCDLPVKFPTKLELVVNNMATEHIAADDPVHDVVERLLHVSGQWVVAAAVDRDETKRRMLEIVKCVIELLTS